MCSYIPETRVCTDTCLVLAGTILITCMKRVAGDLKCTYINIVNDCENTQNLHAQHFLHNTNQIFLTYALKYNIHKAGISLFILNKTVISVNMKIATHTFSNIEIQLNI